MILTGKVIKSFREERDLVGKDGEKKHMVVSRVLLMIEDELASCCSYDSDFVLPKVGELHWNSPSVKRYENYKGMVAEVVF